MKQWRCTVCDFIHKGDSPPETCPVCSSESSLFVAAGEEKASAAADQTEAEDSLRWQCAVCGYIHTGPEPPDKCPVCGADRSQFVCLDVESEASEAPPQAAAEGDAGRRWRCTVCGYIHTGPEPPSICPVCGADRSMFEEVVDESGAAADPEVVSSTQPDPSGETNIPGATPRLDGAGMIAKINAYLDRYRDWIDLAIENHAHPISVHIPNGVLPIAVVMVVLASFFDMPMLGKAGFYNMVFILLSMPAVLFTGYLHWQYKFGGHMTPLFRNKLISGAVVTLLAFILVFWGLVDPQVAENPSLIYVGLHLVMLGVAGYAGYLGGRLVFHRAS